MHIDWNAFTPWSALAGGALIGLAASALILLNGRIAGISGIVGGLLRPHAGDSAWRLAFLAGLMLAPLLWTQWAGPVSLQLDADIAHLALAGFLVGLGTRCAQGCTSGHGVCGLSRLSPRSALATLCFMGAGMFTVWALRHGGTA